MFFVLYDNEYKTKESKNLMEAKTEPQNACIVVNICSRFKIVQTSLFFSFVSQIHHHGLKENEKKKKARLVSFIKFLAQYHSSTLWRSQFS